MPSIAILAIIRYCGSDSGLTADVNFDATKVQISGADRSRDRSIEFAPAPSIAIHPCAVARPPCADEFRPAMTSVPMNTLHELSLWGRRSLWAA
jgi:hypothetical protein